MLFYNTKRPIKLIAAIGEPLIVSPRGIENRLCDISILSFRPKNMPQKKFSKITDAQIKSLSSDAQQGLIAQLERAVYWYSIKQVNFHGQTEPRLIELNGFLYRLTKDKLYCEKEDSAKKHEIFANEILKEPTEKV